MKRDKITETDFINFQRLHIKPPKSSIFPIVVVTSAMMVYIFLVTIRDNLFIGILSFIIPAILFSLLVIIYFKYILPNIWRRHYTQNKELSLPFEMEIDENGISIATELSKARHPWNHFIKWKENQHLILLYKADNIATVIPKRIFDEKEIEYIHDKIKSNNIPIYDSGKAIPKWVSTSLIMLLVIICFLVYLLYSYYISIR